MENQFRIGDVVQLRSGGMRMTIEQMDGDQVACAWFEGKTLERATFITGALQKFVPTPMGVARSRRT